MRVSENEDSGYGGRTDGRLGWTRKVVELFSAGWCMPSNGGMCMVELLARSFVQMCYARKLMASWKPFRGD